MTLSVALCAYGLTEDLHASPVSLRIDAVHVEAEGQWRPDPKGDQTAEQCAGFRLANPAAARWFRKAREVTEREWLEELDWTQCFVSGKLTANRGREYSWEIDQSGRGRIVISPTVSVYMSGPELYK